MGQAADSFEEDVFFFISEGKILDEMIEFKLLKNNFVSRSTIHSLVKNTCKGQRYFPKHLCLPGRHLFDVNHIKTQKKFVIRQGESSHLKT